MTEIVVRPVRFSDQVGEMQRFLELIGLRPWIVSDGGGWIDMACGAGRVALHDAATSDSGVLPGQTTLSFEADDVQALAQRLTDLSVAAVTVYDEAYGRVLTCADPAGDIVAVDEQMDDLHGYQLRAESRPAGWLRVMPVRFADPAGPYAAFLQALGLQPAGEINPYYVNFLAEAGTHGQVGVHHLLSDTPPVVSGGRGAAVQLTFESGEPLEQIAGRLDAAGFAAQLHAADFGTVLSVTDPDGQDVQVHAPSAPA